MSLLHIRKFFVLATFALGTSCSLQAEQPMDFNEVGKQVSILLQNAHLSRMKWDEKLSERILDTHLDNLDPARMYFLQADVDRFKKDYGPRLHNMLLQKTSVSAAEDIFSTFAQRVKDRTSFAQKLVKENAFDFTKEEFIERTRKNAAWAKDASESDLLWQRNVKESILSETLRRESIARRAVEQKKPDPSAKEKSIQEKLTLRYERMLHNATESDSDDIANAFLSSVTKSFDPHTEYMGYREIARFRDGMKNQLIGIGAQLQEDEDGATVIKGIVIGGPADKQGELKLNDRIVGVDSKNEGEVTDIMYMKLDKVVDLIRGTKKTEVRLKVEPADAPPGETKFITIVRDAVEMKDEQATAEIIQMKRDGVEHKFGWITLPSFYMDFDSNTASCSRDMEALLRGLMKEKISGLIIDLRGNGGGSLEEVRKITGFFNNPGPVVQVKDEVDKIEVKDSESKEPLYKGALVILTDKTSASASEILAGALQDSNRAVIVGDSSTFGKGTVQQLMDVGRMMPFFSRRDRAGTVKVTLQKFYRPSGDSTQLKGVASDIVLPSIFDALEIGEEHLDHVLPFDRIRQAADFQPLAKENLFLPRLKELSDARVSKDQDMIYNRKDAEELKTRIKENQLSLKKDVRDKEITQAEIDRKARNAERKERFAQIEKIDKESMKFFKLTLDDVAKNRGPKAYEPSAENQDYMRRAKNDTEDLDDTPKWPSGMDLVKREGVAILADLVKVTEEARVAGLLK